MMDQIPAPTFRSRRGGIAKFLGPLEAELMEIVWATRGPLTARAVLERMGTSPAYVTIVTVLNNLVRKGLLTRERKGRAHEFSPLIDRHAFVTAASDEVIRGLLDLSPRIAVNSFAGALGALSAQDLAELRNEVESALAERDDDDES